MKCPTCSMVVPVCELCEGCRRQSAQTLESTQARLQAAQAELQSLRKLLVSAQDIAAEALGKQNEARGEIQSLRNLAGQKHVEIEQLKNSIESAVQTETSKVRGYLEIALEERNESRAEVRALETKLKAADQAYVAMKTLAQGHLEFARKERDAAMSEVRELKQRNENQYRQLRNLTQGLREGLGLEDPAPKPIAIIDCYFQKHGCLASMAAHANVIETEATRQGWKVRSILDRDSGVYRFRCYCPPHAMGSEELERLEAIEAANRAEKSAQKNPHF